MKLGKDEQYLKDGHELDAYLLKVALKDASVETGGDGSRPMLHGDALDELARQYVLAERRDRRAWRNWMDVEALRAIADGADARPRHAGSGRGVGAWRCRSARCTTGAEVAAEFDARTDKHAAAHQPRATTATSRAA